MSNKPYRPPAQAPQQQRVLAVSHEWHGPIPHPSELEAFEKVLPGLAGTIVEMAKQEAEHRRHLDDLRAAEAADIRKGDHAARTRGQWLAFFVVAVFTAGGVSCAYLHAPWASAIFAVSGLGTIVRAFLSSADKSAKGESGK